MGAATEQKYRQYFAGKVIWITGASAGIGEALALQLSEYGARLVLSARRQDRLEQLQQRCAAADRHLVLPLDVQDEQAMTAAVASVRQRYGCIDCLVNNAGVSQRSLIADTSMAVHRRLMEVNYFGAVALTQQVLPVMQQQKSGQIVVISSIAGLIGTPMRSGYCAAKHALHGYFESLRAEYWRDHIQVTMVYPGGVRTEVSLNALAGDGSAHGVMDELQDKGMAVQDCAAQIIDAMWREQAEVVVAKREKLAVLLQRLAPGVLRRIMKTAKVT